MRIIYSGGFSEDERLQTRAVIYDNIIGAFKALLEIMSAENTGFGTSSAKVGCKVLNSSSFSLTY
jgi:guanine nucleotide-binding protein subunit alpha